MGPAWHELWPDDRLTGFEVTSFGGEGDVTLHAGRLELEPGSPLTGVTATAPLPCRDYVLEFTACRRMGNDFFCGATFPVGDAHLTLVLGGWGGAVCGLSCLDGDDAARNDTKRLRSFAKDRPVRVAIAVRGPNVRVDLDGERFLDVDTTGRALSLRPEVEPCRPLGFCSYQTRAAIWDARWRPAP